MKKRCPLAPPRGTGTTQPCFSHAWRAVIASAPPPPEAAGDEAYDDMRSGMLGRRRMPNMRVDSPGADLPGCHSLSGEPEDGPAHGPTILLGEVALPPREAPGWKPSLARSPGALAQEEPGEAASAPRGVRGVGACHWLGEPAASASGRERCSGLGGAPLPPLTPTLPPMGTERGEAAAHPASIMTPDSFGLRRTSSAMLRMPPSVMQLSGPTEGKRGAGFAVQKSREWVSGTLGVKPGWLAGLFFLKEPPPKAPGSERGGHKTANDF